MPTIPTGTACPAFPVQKNWPRWLEPDEWRLVSFYRDVSRAEALVQMRVAQAWFRATKHDWKACAEMLAWRFPDRWTAEGSAAWHEREQAEAMRDQAEREARHRRATGQDGAEHPVDCSDRTTIEEILRAITDGGVLPDARVDA
jgi:hypothetical protein